MTPLSTRAKILLGNIAVVGLALILLAGAARLLIERVLQQSLDQTLKEMTRPMQRPKHGPKDGRPHGSDFPHDHPGTELQNNPPADLGMDKGKPFRQDRPPPMNFASDFGRGTLLPLRMIRLEDTLAVPPMENLWSEKGFVQARAGKENWHTEVRDAIRIRVYSVLHDNPDSGGEIVQSAARLSEMESALVLVTFSLALLLPVALIVAGTVGAVLTRFALQPLRQMSETVETIAEKNLSERLPIPAGKDEFATLAHQINGMLVRLEESFARQKRFTAHASHELRTPLAIIKTATSLFLGDTPLSRATERAAIQSANEAADRASRLVSDLLLLARADKGALPIRTIPFDMEPFLQQAAMQAKTAYGKPAAEIHIQCDDRLRITTDRDLLLRVLSNLLNNALRYTPETGSITLRATPHVPQTDNLEITVSDNGQGIAAEDFARLGEPFYRPDAARDRESGGTGLGLSICKGIVSALNGAMAIESVEGRGTTVKVLLPR